MDSLLPIVQDGSGLAPLQGDSMPAEVALLGYQDQGNLGMGYLAAVLRERGHTVHMIDIRDGAEKIAERLVGRQPLVVGFSLIFQVFLPQFRRVAAHLRAAGVTSHFTIGGHFPSLCHEEVLAQFPEIDSVVRYEGEITLVDLVERLVRGRDWRQTPGIVYLRDGEIVQTEPRHLVEDLDTLPYPYRPFEPEQIGGFPTLPLLASRGCARTCSFCSIHTFYRTAPGKVVRVRKPAKVIEEMAYLHRHHGVRVILFQDDDFPLWGRAGRRWADELVRCMYDAGMVGRVIWKISCRAEYVERELFAKLADAGLFLVYMGIESGTEEGLEVLNKEMTVDQNLQAVATLKEVGIQVSYGFMLFDPSSTFDSIRENLGFLRKMVGDGMAAATFSRMLPYGGTPIRDTLRKEGRLRGDLTHPDYDFLDLRLNEFHRLLVPTVRPWIYKEGLSYQLNYAWDELDTFCRLAPDVQGAGEYRADLQSLTAESNDKLLTHVEECLDGFLEGDLSRLDVAAARAYCIERGGRLLERRNSFVRDNVDLLMDTVTADCTSGPVMVPQTH
ncbi:MAG TPA: radical SAM protein [Bryobacteraceae bacterium]|nr:radical SAM protein [Bryobacteraceae bacterium]